MTVTLVVAAGSVVVVGATVVVVGATVVVVAAIVVVVAAVVVVGAIVVVVAAVVVVGAIVVVVAATVVVVDVGLLVVNVPWKAHTVVPVAVGGGDGRFPCADATPAPTTATEPIVSATAIAVMISFRGMQAPPTLLVATMCSGPRMMPGPSHTTQTTHKWARRTFVMN